MYFYWLFLKKMEKMTNVSGMDIIFVHVRKVLQDLA